MAVVMLLEDEETLRRSMARALSRLKGVDVIEVSRLEEARRVLATEAPAVVVSDLSLPDGCGVDLLSEIQNSGRQIPIIFVSAWLGQYRDLIPVRPDIEVFEKPLPTGDLRRAVVKHLQQWRSAQPAPFALSDYLQLAAMGRQSVLFRLRRKGVLIGRLTVIQGDLWSARFGELVGKPAAMAILREKGLDISVESVAGDPGPPSVGLKLEFILLEAARQQDEIGGGLGNLGPPLLDLTPIPNLPDMTSQLDTLLDKGLDALLLRDYPAAWAAFSEAESLRPGDPVVRANLNRMREMGHAPELS